jgi:hypothetical protein
MDVIGQTTPLQVADSPEALRAAVQALHDQAALRDLVALYAIARDDHDIESLLDCYAPDGTFMHGATPVSGHAALREYYLANMRRNAFSLHIPHSHVISLESPTEGSGLVTGHGEFAHPDTLVMCAYRYTDRYVKLDGRWVFASRGHDFVYALPVGEMAGVGRDRLRLRWPHRPPAEAEWRPRPV